jgi:hypothetical protein
MFGRLATTNRWTPYYENASGKMQFRLTDTVAGTDIGNYPITLNLNTLYCLEVLWISGTEVTFYLGNTARISGVAGSSDINRVMKKDDDIS